MVNSFFNFKIHPDILKGVDEAQQMAEEFSKQIEPILKTAEKTAIKFSKAYDKVLNQIDYEKIDKMLSQINNINYDQITEFNQTVNNFFEEIDYVKLASFIKNSQIRLTEENEEIININSNVIIYEANKIINEIDPNKDIKEQLIEINKKLDKKQGKVFMIIFFLLSIIINYESNSTYENQRAKWFYELKKITKIKKIKVVNVNSVLYLRKRPSYKTEIIDELYPGTEVLVIRKYKNRNWYFIEVDIEGDILKGYVHSSFLKNK